MNWLVRLLRSLFVLGPREFILALVKLLFLLLILILVLLLRLWEWLLKILRSRNLYPEERDEPCGRLPEAIIRRPDPAIYSQRLLQSQGLPVTWNNPDIWMAPAVDPTAIEPDSYHLVEDTDYVVSVRVHNASTDAAIGVRVRLNYRPWSFNSPDLVPVETGPGGAEVVRFVNVAPMSATVAKFMWHTPPVSAGQASKHHCLQASLYHPLDTNTGNNMGQENTNVWRSENPGLPAPGQTVEVGIPLFNHSRRPRTFRFQAIRYEVDDTRPFVLTLQTTRGRARRSLSQRVANFVPVLHVRRKGATARARNADGTRVVEPKPTFRQAFSFFTQPRVASVKNRYVGFEQIRDAVLAQDTALPAGMAVMVAGVDPGAGTEIAAKHEALVPFEIKIPHDAAPGDQHPITLVAVSDDGVLAGGVTLILKVRE